MQLLRLSRSSGDGSSGSARSGVTLVELIAASVAVALLAAVTLIAFLTSARISSQSNQNVGAAYLLRQTIERFRNQVACDNTGIVPGAVGATPQWFGANCTSVADFSANEPLPPGYTTRNYKVQAVDCDQDTTNPNVPDCFEVTTTVHWDPPR